MKKHLILVLIMILTSILSFSQVPVKQDYDLKKYSYPIFFYELMDSASPNSSKADSFYVYRGKGTCFFIRKNSKLYLITAFHVFTNREVVPGQKSKAELGGLLRINFFPEEGTGAYIELDADTIIHNSSDINLMKNPDLFVYEMPFGFYSHSINSIEDFIPDSIGEITYPLQMISYGFARSDNGVTEVKPTEDNANVPLYAVPYSGKLKLDVSDINQKANWIFSSSTHMHPMNRIDSLNYVANPKFEHGASGAPVFFSSMNNGKEMVWFAGLVSTISPDDFTVIVKEEFIIKELEYLIKSGRHNTTIPGVQ